jgi:hypothetical protein
MELVNLLVSLSVIPRVEETYTNYLLLSCPVLFSFDRQESFEKFMDWRQCAAVMQREAVTVIPSFNGGGNVIVA